MRKILITALSGIIWMIILSGCPHTTISDPVVFSELLYERYLEHYNSDTGPLEAWMYDSDNTLDEYTVFNYTDGLNTEVLIYSTDQNPDESVLTAKVIYQWDGNGNVVYGELQAMVDEVLTTLMYYNATYNDEGYYLEYLEYDGDDRVVEHRICSYDETDMNYITETYYSDEEMTDKIEEYTCTYDDVETWKWISEDHYLKIQPDDSESTETFSYERNMHYTYTWNGDLMYHQSDFDETGAIVSVLMYTYNDEGSVKTRSYFNHEGKLILYRDYIYDDLGDLQEIRYLNYLNPEGDELELRETYKYYQDEENDMFEMKIYTYDYAGRSVSGKDLQAGTSGFMKPGPAHHRNN